jgi:hypothetical protein
MRVRHRFKVPQVVEARSGVACSAPRPSSNKRHRTSAFPSPFAEAIFDVLPVSKVAVPVNFALYVNVPWLDAQAFRNCFTRRRDLAEVPQRRRQHKIGISVVRLALQCLRAQAADCS